MTAITFQTRVQPWLLACFGAEIAADRSERNHRFLEESLELVQACGCSASEARQLVDYVFGRPVGDPVQEVGGVMVTLAALCLANTLDMHEAAETELARIWTKVEAIRAKQAAKPKHSPLPAAPAAVAGPAREEIAALRAEHGITSTGRGIKEFEQVDAFVRAALQRWGAAPALEAPAAPPNDIRDAALWREHVQKLDTLVAYCPTCTQGFAATGEMTRDQIIFECGKTAGRSAAERQAPRGRMGVTAKDTAALELAAEAVFEADKRTWLSGPTYLDLHEDDKQRCRAMARAALAAAPQAPAAPSASEVITGALFDFLGYLTTLPKASAVTFSSSHEATSAVEHLRTWAGSRNLQLEPADVSGWPHRLAAPAAPAVDAQDAARWRAFIASDRIRFFGWAGADSKGRKEENNIYDEPNGNYVHFGAEFWSEHAARTEDPETTARLLTTYADACIAAQAAAKGATND